ncbi:VIT family protein [Alpinimonas psychrophila]|uniref:VIT1/CCC1 family predicted Fe2+/Mn2+ transporter n=1 Tax=Alpinimonas psychrophila TaxID=748908 RepID=A0A7W3JVL3_9MICO|nr:VIT family protein [Alpinimonas psychrophila]MBA8829962.1 VIT1/CCC1 family predicted Fe2+/Mn2+ transporter [Alpinimonas psychrophila]
MTNHGFEPHEAAFASKLNWLRAGVLGANDGIVSVAALVVGVAAATTDPGVILLTATAALVAGAISMALGEYVSVSSQRDSEIALIAKERTELAEEPEAELLELAGIYASKGLSAETAHKVAVELTAHDALRAHLEAELNISGEHLTNPLHAALSSAIAFVVGAAIPLATILLSPVEWRIGATFISVLVALALTGGLGAYIGGSQMPRAILRVTIGGAAALAITFGIGKLIGGTVL